MGKREKMMNRNPANIRMSSSLRLIMRSRTQLQEKKNNFSAGELGFLFITGWLYLSECEVLQICESCNLFPELCNVLKEECLHLCSEDRNLYIYLHFNITLMELLHDKRTDRLISVVWVGLTICSILDDLGNWRVISRKQYAQLKKEMIEGREHLMQFLRNVAK